MTRRGPNRDGAAAGAVLVVALLLGGVISLAGTRSDAAAAGATGAGAAGTGSIEGMKGERVVFSGGCFWGVQAVFEHVDGVVAAVAGYAGGPADAASYDRVSTGATGHAESVLVVYDPARVSFEQLLRVFFEVAHDPTQLNRQGPDRGPQYRSAIWTTTPEQARRAREAIRRLTEAKAFRRPIVTEVNDLSRFYPAEAYHQDYLIRHPRQPYIVVNDLPKLERLKKAFPSLWREEPVRWQEPAAATEARSGTR